MAATLYPGIPFSPQATLTNNIGAADSIIEVSDVSAFPPAPNLATIGTDEEGETILYTAKTGTALSGCQRGVEGTAKAWTAGELIGRNFTAKDHVDLIAAVTEIRDAATAAEHAAQFGRWAPGVSYKAGAIRSYEGLLYQCVQEHTSQADWNPSAAASLWTKIADPSEEWPAWSQPIGAHDAYGEGDKVSHNGGKWVSFVGSNVWEPGVHGWEAYTGEDGEAALAALSEEPEAVDLEAMTIPQLKAYAQERGINLTGKTLKADMIAAIRAVL